MTLEREVEAMLAELRREVSDASCASARGVNDRGVPDSECKRLARAVPDQVARLLRTIDLLSLRTQALAQIELELFGWRDRREGYRSLDTPTVRSQWHQAVSGSARAETMKIVRHVIDDTKHLAQIQRLQAHECASALPSWQAKPQVRDGVLNTRDVSRGSLTFGVRSYPEATPIEIFVLVVRMWMQRTGKQRPLCWDMTGGSGTGHDVITTVFGGQMISTDIALDNGKTVYGDIREAGRLSHHRGRVGVLERGPEKTVKRPDLVFIHPPSRGWPACAWVYGRDTRAVAQDLGVLLERDLYVGALADAITASVGKLADGGLISVLVPEGVRLHQTVVHDPGIADALLERLAAICTLVEQHAVVDEQPVRQASLGTTRGPVEHLILAKKVTR
jgi:hypothetical protein